MTVTPPRRSFIGWSGSRGEPPVVPAESTSVWAGPRPLWTVGEWQPHEMRVLTEATVRAAFLGACPATDAQLRDAVRSMTAGGRVDLLRTLPGSFAVVIDNGHHVQVLTDRAGLHPVFHTRLADGTVFSSDALMAAALHHRNLGEAINSRALSATLFAPDLPDLGTPDSVFSRVQRIGPDHVLAIPADQRVWARRLPAPAHLTDVGVARTTLREALETAVGVRVRNAGRLSTDLSGGLDSSTLAVLAARAGAQPLAVTYADSYAVNDEDVQFAAQVTVEVGLRQAVVTGDAATLPFTAMETTPLTDEPSLDTLIIARTRHRLSPALAYGSELHLTGDGGDVVLTAPGLTYLGDLARARNRHRLRHEADGWARLRHLPARQVRQAAHRLAATPWPDTVRHLTDHLANPHPTVPARRNPGNQLAWTRLSPAAAWAGTQARRALIDQLHLISETPRIPRSDSADGAALRTLHGHGAATRTFSQITRALGLPVHAPYFDNQVIDACLAVTAADRTTVDRAKPLLAAATADILPAALLKRRTKGDYTGCEYHGLRANARPLRELLADPYLAAAGILDPEGPRDVLRRGLTGVPIPMGALGAVIATERWLRALDTLDSTGWWIPTPQRQEQTR